MTAKGDYRAIGATLGQRMLELDERLGRGDDPQALYDRVKQSLDEALVKLASSGIWGVENRPHSGEFWAECGALLARGRLQGRARSKPRGYAGDYELLGRIIREEVCDDPLGRLLDLYFQAEAAPQAVRNRTIMVRDWICGLARGAAERKIITVVGCGPALDVIQAVESLASGDRQHLEVRLLDLDPEAVAAAESRLTELLSPGQLRLQAENLFRLPRRPRLAAWLDDSHLTVCTGLFDYFDDATAAEMLGEFWRRLAPGGRCAVFNFAPENPSRAFMEWVGNWYLIYRDRSAMVQMAEAAGIPPGQFDVIGEPLGIDLCILAKKPGPDVTSE